MYYGQLLNGKRDGYGISYCTNSLNSPYLHECQWKEGTPIQGRYIEVVDNKWYKYEGALDAQYLESGLGCSLYEITGEMYEGTCFRGWQHGEGKRTHSNGDYQIGEYEKGRPVGTHRHFDKKGELIKITEYK